MSHCIGVFQYLVESSFENMDGVVCCVSFPVFAVLSLFPSFSSLDLRTRHGLRTYELERSCCYDALLLDEERGRLFVGGKNFLASLSLDNISKQEKKVTGLYASWGLPLQ